MTKTGLVMVALAAVTLSGCAGRYYERDYRGYSDSRYDSAVPGGVYYTDRSNYNDPYYSNYPSREVRDWDGRRFDRDD